MSAEAATTDRETETVYVVTCRREGEERPHVAGVYETEAAAEKHRRDLADNSHEYGTVAWGVHEAPVREAFDDAR